MNNDDTFKALLGAYVFNLILDWKNFPDFLARERHVQAVQDDLVLLAFQKLDKTIQLLGRGGRVNIAMSVEDFVEKQVKQFGTLSLSDIIFLSQDALTGGTL